ncbi:MAG TPA: prolipoprotein diacylglyceryl transferase [bacterium]|nr:prolipoprotein diacylglyceryl transferase [bacterium]HPS28872.1 prolipoprotein diacylglyceryl transferase [bacterium]
MLNWLTGGVVDLNTYTRPLIFAFAIFTWFMILKRYIPVKENYRLLIKVAAISFTGAITSPLIIFTISGNLISFLKRSINLLEKVNNINSLQQILNVAFKGFSITGGITLLAIVLIFVVKDAKKVTFGILYPFPLFAAITRINCFFEGCCFGKLYEGPCSVTFPPASYASKYHYSKYGLASRFIESLPVYPTQLMLVFSMFFLFLIVFIMNFFKVARNIIAGTVLTGYGFFNFIIEFFRSEPRVFGSPFTIGQYMEITLIILGFYMISKVKDI